MTRERTIQVVVGALCVVAFVAIFAILGEGEIDEATGRVLAVAFTIALYTLLALAGNRLRESGEAWSWLGLVAIGLCALGALFACGFWVLIDDDDGAEQLARLAGIFGVFALVTSHGSLLINRIGDRTDTGAAVRFGTFACGLVIATMISIEIAQNDGGDLEESRFFAVVGILYLLGSVISPLLRLGEGREDDPAA